VAAYLTAILSFLSTEGPKLIPIATAIAAAIASIYAKNYSQAWQQILSILTILGGGGAVVTMHYHLAALPREVASAVEKADVARLIR